VVIFERFCESANLQQKNKIAHFIQMISVVHLYRQQFVSTYFLHTLFFNQLN